MSQNPLPVVRITSEELRIKFNELDFPARIENGEVIPVVTRDGHPSPPKADEPECTRSQEVSYRDSDGNELARVHQYLRRDSTIGASGRPDPKRLRQGDTLFRLLKGSAES